jgi:hypothetical protein
LNTQNDQNKSQTRPQPLTPTPKGRNKKQRGLARDARVHCAVLKKQPGPPRPHHPYGVARPPVPQSEATGLTPVSSGPNSVSNLPVVRRPAFPLPEGRYQPSRTADRLSSQCSTSMSSHLTNMRRQK